MLVPFIATLGGIIGVGMLLLAISYKKKAADKKNWCSHCKNFQHYGKFCVTCGSFLDFEPSYLYVYQCQNCKRISKVDQRLFPLEKYNFCFECGSSMEAVNCEPN